MVSEAESFLRSLVNSLAIDRDYAARMREADGLVLRAGEIAEHCNICQVQIPGLNSHAEGVACKQVGLALKKAFGEWERLPVDGYLVARERRYEAKSGRDIISYRFSLAEQPESEGGEQC